MEATTEITLKPTYTSDGVRIYGSGRGVYFHGEWFTMDCGCGAHTEGWVVELPYGPGVVCDQCDRSYALDETRVEVA